MKKSINELQQERKNLIEDLVYCTYTSDEAKKRDRERVQEIERTLLERGVRSDSIVGLFG